MPRFDGPYLFFADNYFNCLSAAKGVKNTLMLFNAAQDCGPLAAPENGTSTGELTVFPNKILFGCDEGFLRRGSSIRHCQANGTWSGNQTICEGCYCWFICFSAMSWYFFVKICWYIISCPLIITKLRCRGIFSLKYVGISLITKLLSVPLLFSISFKNALTQTSLYSSSFTSRFHVIETKARKKKKICLPQNEFLKLYN